MVVSFFCLVFTPFALGFNDQNLTSRFFRLKQLKPPTTRGSWLEFL